MSARNFIVSVMTLSVFGLGAILYGWPQYNVYSMRLVGQANLAHSVADAEVQVQEAQGKYNASKLLAQADVERAKGVAQANQIIGESLKNNESYIRWLFVQGLETTKNQIIYVPTETQLPILEATRKPAP